MAPDFDLAEEDRPILKTVREYNETKLGPRAKEREALPSGARRA